MLKPGDMVLVKKPNDPYMEDVPAVVVKVNAKSARVETPYCDNCEREYCEFNNGRYLLSNLKTR